MAAGSEDRFSFPSTATTDQKEGSEPIATAKKCDLENSWSSYCGKLNQGKSRKVKLNKLNSCQEHQHLTPTLDEEFRTSSNRKMSKGRVFSRPRTKVYDTNYNIGESLYRPALDRLDQKYGGRPFGEFDRVANGDAFGMRSPLPPPAEPAPLRSALREVEDEFFGEGPRRRPNSALLEYDSIFEGRARNGPSAAGRSLDEEIEEGLSSSMRRLRTKASRSVAEEFDDLESGFGKKDSRMRPRLDFGEKVMESVGLTGRARQALEDEGSTVARMRFTKTTTSADAGESEDLTRWTALKPAGSSRRNFFEEEDAAVTQSAAAARARKSRARLDDLESEMQVLSERSAAREKRARDLRALVQENEASALDNLQATVRVKSSIQSEKRTVAF